MMDYLEKILQLMISKGKGDGRLAHAIRAQMAGLEDGQSAQQKYIIGMAQEVPKATK